jgi:predicted naringenin-chalcone synthase
MVEPRNAIYKREAPQLSLESAEQALEHWGGERERITHIVAVTCTGIIVPGLEFQILSGLGLSNNVQRLSIQFMGCFGALSGMKAARAFALEDPNNRILLVCTELCSLHMQLDDRIDNLVGSSLFADGSAAMIIGCNPTKYEKALYEMHENASIIIPDTLDMMAWELTNSGMSIGLGKEIPDAIYQNIDIFCANMLGKTKASDVKFNECLWAIHPGGPMILSAISNRLGINELHTKCAWEVLRKYGNMSSATLIFVLKEMLEQFENGIDKRKREKEKKKMEKSERNWYVVYEEEDEEYLPDNPSPFVPALAFGPGLNVEGCLLKYVAKKI